MTGEGYAFFRWHSFHDRVNWCSSFKTDWHHRYHLKFWEWGNR